MSGEALRAAAEVSKAWPFEEARKLVARVERTGQREVLFETGYGPSGLPHMGTFGEVARTTMVRHAFRVLTGDAIRTRLIAFFRRHGRPSQGARQYSQSRTGVGVSGQAALGSTRPVRGV